ncbi:MAG: hypothetical protein AAFU65_12045 [Pseudomonadota bacterium]
MRKLIFSIAMTAVLTGCGGGGGGEAESGGTTVTPTPTPPPATTTPDPGTANIDVPTGFDFGTSKQVPVTVSLGPSAPSKTYVTICKPDETSATATPDYGQCLWRGIVEGGSESLSVQVANDVETLVAAVWSFAPADVIVESTWTRATAGNATWVISQ